MGSSQSSPESPSKSEHPVVVDYPHSETKETPRPGRRARKNSRPNSLPNQGVKTLRPRIEGNIWDEARTGSCRVIRAHPEFLDDVDWQGNTALYYASLCGHAHVVDELLRMGAKNIGFRSAYDSALTEPIRAMLKRARFNHQPALPDDVPPSPDAATPPHRAPNRPTPRPRAVPIQRQSSLSSLSMMRQHCARVVAMGYTPELAERAFARLVQQNARNVEISEFLDVVVQVEREYVARKEEAISEAEAGVSATSDTGPVLATATITTTPTEATATTMTTTTVEATESPTTDPSTRESEPVVADAPQGVQATNAVGAPRTLPAGLPPDEKVCKICFVALADTVLIECGHLGLCTNCAAALTHCPFCREEVTRKFRVYYV